MIDRLYKAYCYWRVHGMAMLVQRILAKLAQKLQRPADQLLDLTPGPARPKTVAELCQARFHQLSPLITSVLHDSPKNRVSVITDSVNSGSLFGGVGTALILGALLANRRHGHLRIVTRTERAKPEQVDHLLSLYGITLEQEIQFKFAAFYDQRHELDLAADELFITTSWWTTAAALPSIPAAALVYLLQEDERMFYPFGDDRQRCEAVLRNRSIRFLVNTKLLFDHLVQNGLDTIATQGRWFEPAFPEQIFYPRVKKPDQKRRFFFYARPHNPRNLFYLGIEVIEQAVAEQILDPALWDICLVGKEIPLFTLSNGYAPQFYDAMAWSDYAEFMGTTDLGLSLMYTPHPSYPPLDLAASGAVVVTNRFGGKQELQGYSPNLICADLDKAALVDALRQAVALVSDPELRERNYRANRLHTDWRTALDDVINVLGGE